MFVGGCLVAAELGIPGSVVKRYVVLVLFNTYLGHKHESVVLYCLPFVYENRASCAVKLPF